MNIKKTIRLSNLPLVKVFVSLLLISFLSACGSSSSDSSPSPPTPPPSFTGKVDVSFVKVDTCAKSVVSDVDWQLVGYGFSGGQGGTIYPFMGRNDGPWTVTIDYPITFTVTSSKIFRCGGDNYHYVTPPGNVFTLTKNDSYKKITVYAEKFTTSDDSFHFANPGENTPSSQWDHGSIKN